MGTLFGKLELVDSLDSHRIHGFAQRSATVVEESVTRLVAPDLATDFCVLGRKVGKRYRALCVLRSRHAAHRAEVESVSVLEPLDATREPPCVFEHVGHVSGNARVFGAGTARPRGVVLLEAQELSAEGQGV